MIVLFSVVLNEMKCPKVWHLRPVRQMPRMQVIHVDNVVAASLLLLVSSSPGMRPGVGVMGTHCFHSTLSLDSGCIKNIALILLEVRALTIQNIINQCVYFSAAANVNHYYFVLISAFTFQLRQM